jgi:thioredoxin reductase
LDHDVKSIAGKPLFSNEKVDVLVVGGGPAGIAAAGELAQLGLTVMLVDEHPVDPALVSSDVPLHFGSRADDSIRNSNRTLAQIIEATPEIETLYDLGVDVRLATTAWGLYRNGTGVGWLPAGLVAAIATGDESAIVSCDRMIVAAGRRDVGFAFPGWDLPGVVGVTAASTLIERYCAFSGRRMVILGSGVESLLLAKTALSRGIEVAGIVDTVRLPTGPERLADEVREAGVPLIMSSFIEAAEGSVSGITGVRLISVDERLYPLQGTSHMLHCDTICLAIGAVPCVDAFQILGCELELEPGLGGHVPATGPDNRTSLEGVYAAGDCLGLRDDFYLEPQLAKEEGRAVARHVAMSLDAIPSTAVAADPKLTTPQLRRTRVDSLANWIRASLNTFDDDVVICQCEQATRADILGLRPPAYLGVQQRYGARNIQSLKTAGQLNQDQVKRLTRVGMGICQGRRCREQSAQLLALRTGTALCDIPLPRYRPPLRPLPLAAMQALAEHEEMTAHWDVWFGVPTQYQPYWDLCQATSSDGTSTSYGK